MRDVLLKQWTDIGEKVVKMAEEFPEDKYEFRPVAGVRTFGDQLRHVAFWNGFVAKSARGEKPDGKLNELPKAQYAHQGGGRQGAEGQPRGRDRAAEERPGDAKREAHRSLGVVHRTLAANTTARWSSTTASTASCRPHRGDNRLSSFSSARLSALSSRLSAFSLRADSCELTS